MDGFITKNYCPWMIWEYPLFEETTKSRSEQLERVKDPHGSKRLNGGPTN